MWRFNLLSSDVSRNTVARGFGKKKKKNIIEIPVPAGRVQGFSLCWASIFSGSRDGYFLWIGAFDVAKYFCDRLFLRKIYENMRRLIAGVWMILSLVTSSHAAINFTIIGGQIFTPGLAIVNAPQPFTPLGGRKSLFTHLLCILIISEIKPLNIILIITVETLHISIDVSGNGRLPPQAYQAYPNGTIPYTFGYDGNTIDEDNEVSLPLPSSTTTAQEDGNNGKFPLTPVQPTTSTTTVSIFASTSSVGNVATPTGGTYFHRVTIFLYSYTNGHNLTVANNTLPPVERDNSYSPPVLGMEVGSTVKHVNWIWPDCLRRGMGEYNISIHQSFTYNSSAYYTIFDLPIELINDIDPNRNATSCDLLNNQLWSPDLLRLTSDRLNFQPWVNGVGAQVEFDNGDDDDEDDNGKFNLSGVGGRVSFMGSIEGVVAFVAVVGWMAYAGL
ncbi:hypothetical protein ABW19_dt0208224 [Dactylella cylindrospora]|nr:hypothetical protein ABW19_dt0208224 [Dactylella cylindrospora]